MWRCRLLNIYIYIYIYIYSKVDKLAPLVLSTFVIVALQDSRKVFSFLLTTDSVSLDFFQGVERGWPFLSF